MPPTVSANLLLLPLPWHPACFCLYFAPCSLASVSLTLSHILPRPSRLSAFLLGLLWCCSLASVRSEAYVELILFLMSSGAHRCTRKNDALPPERAWESNALVKCVAVAGQPTEKKWLSLAREGRCMNDLEIPNGPANPWVCHEDPATGYTAYCLAPEGRFDMEPSNSYLALFI